MIKKGSGNIYDFNDNLILEDVNFILKQNIIEISGFYYPSLTNSQKNFFSISNIIKCIIKADKYNIIIDSSVNQDFFNIEKFILKIYDKTILYNNVNDKNIDKVETTLFNFVCDGNNLESIKLNDFEIEIKKLPDYEESIKILNDKQSSFKETYELSLKNIQTEQSDEKSIIIILNNLCNFLSYITCNKVSYYRIHYLNKEDQIFMNTLDFKYPPYYIKEIPFKSNGHTRKFSKIKKVLEIYYDKYEKLLEDYPLNIIFGFYLDALNQNYLEMKYLSSMASLETILDSFDKVYEKNNEKSIKTEINEERNNKGNEIIRKTFDTKLIQKNKGVKVEDIVLKDFKLGNGKLSEIRKGGNLPELKDKLMYFEKYFDITLKDDVSKFIKIRNEITHTGKIPDKLNDVTINPLKEYEILRKVINKLIITIFKS